MTHHICCHEGCGEVGYPCYLDDDLLAGELEGRKATEYLCSVHAVERGYCYGCGRFFAGIDGFDFGPGLCEDCRYEAAEEEEDDEECY